MNVHKQHGGKMAATLTHHASIIIEQSGVIASAAYHGTELPYDGHAIVRAEEAARRVVEAIAEYRRQVEDDPVIDWPRPSDHGRGASRLPEPPGMRASHMLPDVCRCEQPWRSIVDENANCVECGGHIYGRSKSTLAALNGDDGGEAA